MGRAGVGETGQSEMESEGEGHRGIGRENEIVRGRVATDRERNVYREGRG